MRALKCYSFELNTLEGAAECVRWILQPAHAHVLQRPFNKILQAIATSWHHEVGLELAAGLDSLLGALARTTGPVVAGAFW